MRLNNQNRIAQAQAIRTAIFLALVSLFLIAGAPEALATVWNRNQTYQCGHLPATTSSTDDNPGGNCGQSLWPGMPIHIVHGVKDPNGDTTNPVTVKITLPLAFTVKSVELWTFLGGSTTGTKSNSPPPATSLGNFSIGKLGANDKVIVVIEGYFTHAGSYSIPFVAERLGSTPAVTEGSPANLNIAVQNTTPPVDVSVTKEVKDSSGAFASTATWPFGTTVSYRITVKNESSTDLYLGGLLRVQDTLAAPPNNGVPITVTTSGLLITASASGIARPQGSLTPSYTFPPSIGNSITLLTATYPTTGADSFGFLPAGGSFVITFDMLVQQGATCSFSLTNQLNNRASITYFSNTINDLVATNNSSTATVTLTGGPSTQCPPPTVITGTKKITSPTPPPNALPWGPFTYEIKFTTPSIPLTGLTLSDVVYGTGTPPFTATFAASNVTCSPASACPPGSITPATTAPLVGNSQTSLFGISFGSLPPNTPVTITYQVIYDAPCADASTNGTITNVGYLGGPASGSMLAIAKMDTLPICQLQVSKTQTPVVTSFGSYPQTLKYDVQFKNNSPQTVTVGTVVDTIAEDSPLYGDVPIDYSFTCTASNVTPIPAASGGANGLPVKYNTSVGAGLQLLNFSGTKFQPGGIIDCKLSVTLKQPSTTDSLCEGKGKKHNVTNAAYMNLLPNNYNKPPTMTPPWYQDVTTPLPDCVSILVGKTTPSTAYPGGPITFTLTVTNTGNDPLSNIVLQDNVPAWANPASWSWSCTSGPCTGSGTGNLSVTIAPSPLTLAPHATATVTITGTAPDALGSYCNNDNAEIQPFPPLTFFDGGPTAMADLTKAQACIDVKQSDVSPTPRPTATPTPSPSPAAGCAGVSDKEIKCLPGGGYTYTFNVANNSGNAMSQVLLTPVGGGTFTLSPQLTNLTKPLQNGQSTTVTVNIGKAKAGDKVCFFASLMSDKAACCTVQVCPTLPVCEKR